MSREPSMEDILSSIRKVIARDEAAVPAPSLARGEPADEAEVLELGSDSVEADAPDTGELVAADAADAARRSLDALSAAMAAPDAATPPSPPQMAGSRTLDDVVTEALRPMLKAWLDANLPPLVEAMVAKEIARITGRRI
jgi:uncharacterized protein